jgi:hypothetical protein
MAELLELLGEMAVVEHEPGIVLDDAEPFPGPIPGRVENPEDADRLDFRITPRLFSLWERARVGNARRDVIIVLFHLTALRFRGKGTLLGRTLAVFFTLALFRRERGRGCDFLVFRKWERGPPSRFAV